MGSPRDVRLSPNSGGIADIPALRVWPSRPGEFHPEPLTDSGLDTLASSGSCHRAKAAAFRRELELLLLPVGSLPTSVACPLRSTGITPLQHYYGAVRPSPAHQYFRPRGWELSLKVGDGGNRKGGISWGCLTPPLLHRRSDMPCPKITSSS